MLRCSALVSLYHYSVNIMKYKLVFLFLTSIHVNAEQIKTVNKISAGIVYLISLSLLLLNHPSHQPILLLNPSFSSTHPPPQPTPQPILLLKTFFSSTHPSPQPILLLNPFFSSTHPSPQPILLLNPSFSSTNSYPHPILLLNTSFS